LTCGAFEGGFARFQCEGCAREHLVPCSCKGRGVCPSCGGRRMTERAAHLMDEVLPRVPVRQWVLTVPYRLRYQMAWDHALSRAVLGVYALVLLDVYALVLLDVYARCPRAPYPRRSDGHGHGNSALGKRPESERTGRADFHRVVMPLRPGTPRARVSGPLALFVLSYAPVMSPRPPARPQPRPQPPRPRSQPPRPMSINAGRGCRSSGASSIERLAAHST